MSRAPRVLVSGVVLGQPMGGVRRHNQELLPRLARLLNEHGGSLAVMEGRERVAFDIPSSIERIASDVPAGPVLTRARAESSALIRVLNEARAAGRPFDLVHTAHLPAPRGLPVPYTITLHDLRSLARGHAPLPRRLVARRIVRDAARRAARVFTVSHAVADELREVAEIDVNAITVIGNGCDHVTPLPRGAGASAPIVCIGHLEPRKNLDVVLRALAIDPSLPNAEFHGAEKPDETDRLRALARRLGVETRVTFAGPFADADLPAIHARAACVCLPSTIEGFGIGAIEAQHAGTPLVIARTPALVETAGDETPSFAPDDAAELVAAIRSARASTPDRLARAARRAETFTWNAAARRWFEGLCPDHAS